MATPLLGAQKARGGGRRWGLEKRRRVERGFDFFFKNFFLEWLKLKWFVTIRIKIIFKHQCRVGQGDRCFDLLTKGVGLRSRVRVLGMEKILAGRPWPFSGTFVGLARINQAPSNKIWTPVVPSG